MLIPFGFSVELPFLVVFWEDVGYRANIVVLHSIVPPESLNIPPHAVLPTQLVTHREMVESLVLCDFFEVVRFDVASPLHIPPRRSRRN